ncbi:gamma-glutamyltranspeptidase/glutathione hydrolase [Paenibacillus phyllosphaerae]|uniref:Glutathione hydrolase proenzyme n=1 Tax=Paenibacillus phyllosphaerae TaxID=274593 RepID=A0A7W5ATP9_9BACL|nr:gamma-glutamyltransferase [Paenibacillus phyllosphaerae]MBB3108487.1 gamma-glutamyltranspeptidase/glutathione hydrolase [Paenibacillus phyllosphaerae]
MHNIMPKVYRAMVAAPHYLASSVGAAILRQGGNAFDASVAISAALAVVYPHMTGLGGDAFFMCYHADTKQFQGYNGSGRSAKLAEPDYYLAKGMNQIPQRGVDSAITVPGMVDAWWSVWSRYGKLPWADLLAPAIQYAEEGFPVSRHLREWILKDESLIRAHRPLAKLFLRDDGELLEEGDRLIQPDLVRTLRTIQTEGRDAFYKGGLMLSLAEAIEADGGLLREEDFRSHYGEWVTPLTVTYRGYDLYQMPPNSQGFSLLMMMNMLEHVGLGEIPRESADFYHLAVEVVKKAFRERDAVLTDPDFKAIPMGRLLSKEFGDQLWEEVVQSGSQAASFLSQAMGQDTAYAAVVDEEGNAVSFIQSLYYDFGAAYIPGDTGVIMQNRGSFFTFDPASPNVLEPCKRSFHTLMPAMVARDGKPCLLYGTQGGEGQPQTQLSVVTGVLDYGLTIQEAIGLPRFIYGRTWGEESDTLKVESRCGDVTVERLRAMGHQVEVLDAWDGRTGQSQGIAIDASGVISGAADPRSDGSVIGW